MESYKNRRREDYVALNPRQREGGRSEAHTEVARSGLVQRFITRYGVWGRGLERAVSKIGELGEGWHALYIVSSTG